MTTQIANIARLQGSMADLHLIAGRSAQDHIRGKITGVDGVGISIVEITDGERAAEQFFPWTSVGHIVLV